MNYEKAMAWVAALRSGEFKQGSGKLTKIKFGKETNCCLGVECKLAIRDGLSLDVNYCPNFRGFQFIKYNEQEDYLPQEVITWGEFNSYNPEFSFVDARDEHIHHYYLSDLNDDYFTFNQIADLIERFWEQL